MQRMYVSLSLFLCILSFQALSMDSSTDSDPWCDSKPSSQPPSPNEREMAILGMSEHSFEKVIEEKTVYDWLKDSFQNNNSCKAFDFGLDQENEKCAALFGLRQKLIHEQCFNLMRSEEDGKTAYKIARLLEINRPIMLPQMVNALEARLNAIFKKNDTEKTMMSVLLTDYSTRRSMELLKKNGYLSPKTEKLPNQSPEEPKNDREFLKGYTNLFLSENWIKAATPVIYMNILKELSNK